MILHLRLTGTILLALCLLHLTFPRRFDWPRELGQLSLLNRQMFYVHTFFVCLVVAMMGLLCLLWPQELMRPSPLGRLLAAGLMLFWQIRLAVQLWVYDSSLWRGKAFETTVHIVFLGLWTYLTAVFGWLLWLQLRG